MLRFPLNWSQVLLISTGKFLWLPDVRCCWFTGKQKHIKLLHQSGLDGHDTDPVKIPETRGCQLFCVGTTTNGLQGTPVTCLCVAIKRTIQVYELNKTRQKFRKIKDIQVPGQVQCLEMMSQGLCVGCPSYMAIYSVLGDSPPTGEWCTIIRYLSYLKHDLGFENFNNNKIYATDLTILCFNF